MGAVNLEEMEGTGIFWGEANSDTSVSFTNSIFAMKELVGAFLKKKQIQLKCLIEATDETPQL